MKNLLIIGLVWPEPTTTAAGVRMLQLVELFQNLNYKIIFASTAEKTKKSFQLEKLNIQTFQIQLNHSSFDKLLKKINPNTVLFDRFITEEQFGWRVANVCPKTIRILDTEDLHFLRIAREKALLNNGSVIAEYCNSDTTKREIASIYRCDCSLIISKFEYKLLTKTFKIDKSILLYLPFLVDAISKKELKKYPSFYNRTNFIFVGNFKHKPNIAAVKYLKSTIWPLIHKKLPKAQLHIYGSYAEQNIKQLNNKQEQFYIKGWIESIEKALTNYKVCIAPLKFGAGLKGKLLDAMIYGTPSITTTIGAEGMSCDLDWNGFIQDNPDEFSIKAIELYTNQKLWENSQQNGISIINKCYSKKLFTKKALLTLTKIENNLEDHRTKNFIGKILQYNTLRSTMYMSKWIEEKNK